MGFAAPLREDRCDAGKGLWLTRSRSINPLPVSGGQRANVAIESERLRNTAKQMEADETSRFWVSR